MQPASGASLDLATFGRLAATSPLPPGVVRAAVFDADGTLWKGDIGDEAFAGLARTPLLADATFGGPLRIWAERWGLALSSKDEAAAQIATAVTSGTLAANARARGATEAAWREDLYAMQAWIYAGQPRAAVQAYGEQLFHEGFAGQIFEDMRRVIEVLRAAGVEIFIASASHAALVAPGARLLGIDEAHVLGMEPALDSRGHTLPHVPVTTYGANKAAVVSGRLHQQRPLLAFGDSVLHTDKELLALAHFPIAVATKGANREAALADGRMQVFDPR